MTDMLGRITFNVYWIDEYGQNLDVPALQIRRHCLSDAITAACNVLKTPRHDVPANARGFYVRAKRR